MSTADWTHRYPEEEVTGELVGHLLSRGFAVRVNQTRQGLTAVGWEPDEERRCEVDAYHARRRFAA